MAGWDDVDIGSEGAKEKKPFIKIETSKQVRIITEPKIFYKHWTPAVSGKFVTVKCPGTESCVVCQKNPADKPRKRGMLVVLDRSDEKLKFYDVPNTVLGQLKVYHKDKNWGPLAGYDVTITANGSGKNTKYYVTPYPHAPLPEDVAKYVQDEITNFDVESVARPNTPEEILALLNEEPRPQSKDGAKQFTQTAGYGSPPATPAATPTGSQEDVPPTISVSSVSSQPQSNSGSGVTGAESVPPTSIPPGNLSSDGKSGVPPSKPSVDSPADSGVKKSSTNDNAFFENFL